MNPGAPFTGRRIVVVGITGSGKSTLAEWLAARLQIPFIELDALFWKPGWVEAGTEEFRAAVDAATQAPAWALAGNYSKARDLIWPRAEALVWLDYPYLLVLGWLWKRTWQRWRTQEALWGTNYERLWPQFMLWSPQSLFHWQVRSYRKFRRVYPQLLADPQYAHLKVYRFRRPEQTEAWLDLLGNPVPRELPGWEEK